MRGVIGEHGPEAVVPVQVDVIERRRFLILRSVEVKWSWGMAGYRVWGLTRRAALLRARRKLRSLG